MAETKVDLFSGKPMFFGGLSNERELVKHLPPDFPATFSASNPWKQLAEDIFFNGRKTRDWEWRATDAAVRAHQLACFKSALSGFDLKHEQKIALCGWMLSEMLTEVPK